MKTCEITGCAEPAEAHVEYCHPDESLRWSANLCRVHMRPEAGLAGSGEWVYGMVKEKQA